MNDIAYKFLCFAKMFVAKVTNTTTVMELSGIKIAAKTGDNKPWTAKVNPTMLYKKEMIKLTIIIRILPLQ